MLQVETVYNERSWAIDLIGILKSLVIQNNRSIKDAGGERTIKSEGGSLFPDVLLFGDRATARILQGWELKMPDTDIHDHEFRLNAEKKANILGLDSFLLWNVSHARLYIRSKETDQFVFENEWSDLADITERKSVLPNRLRWEVLAAKIIGYLNDLFDRGSLEGRQFIDAYRSGGITALIMENTDLVADALHDAVTRNGNLRDEVVLWWAKYKDEYIDKSKEKALAQAVILNWVGKILFAHILREKDQRAQHIANFQEDTTPVEALEFFRQLSEDCNFWTIFSDSLGLTEIPNESWGELKQFNSLLADLRVGAVDQEQLSGILETTVDVARRKLRGQYTTPIELARLLVNLCVRDRRTERILDPCCGSGTIARAALEQKLSVSVSPEDASKSIFAGDQDQQVTHISTFALAKPSLMHIPLRIFQKDVFTLTPSTTIELQNPTDGTLFKEVLGKFEVIISNLPFVAQTGREHYGDAIRQVNTILEHGNCERFSGRADIAAYLPFSLHSLLADQGRLGIIMTNAWLGTAWGDAFYESLGQYYTLKSVITSGAGRWFQNSDVVTNILIMEKKEAPNLVNGSIKFVVLKRPLEEIANGDALEVTSAQIELGQIQDEAITIRSVTTDNLNRFRKYGLGGNAQFVNCDWILELPLVPLSDLFHIRRGERRGMNALFYPASGHDIEEEYIRPLAKSPNDFTRLCGQAAKEAFSCDRIEEELEELGYTGALTWIRRFNTPQNIQKLSRENMLWYEMNTDRLAELVMFINYGERLFVGRLKPPAFVDQRMIALDPLGDVDIDLCHALQNSSISMFILEGLGFGRGLGALDLNKDRIEDYMHILNPSKLSQEQISNIKREFTPLLNRDILGVADELEQNDRRSFDDAIIKAFDLCVSRDDIYESLLELVGIRLTANQ